MFTPLIGSEIKRKGRVGSSWRLDETYIRLKVYSAVDKLGNTADFLLTRKRQRMSAQSFPINAISNNYKPRVINIDKGGSNTAAIKIYNRRSFSKVNISIILLNRIIVLSSGVYKTV